MTEVLIFIGEVLLAGVTGVLFGAFIGFLYLVLFK